MYIEVGTSAQPAQNMHTLIQHLRKKIVIMKYQSFLKALALSILICASFTNCKQKRTDADIQTEVNQKIANNAEMSGLTASVNDGVVTLTGQCKDETCKKNCADEIEDIKGVKSVVNNISIGGANTNPAPVEITSDEPLRAAVNEALRGYDKVEAEVKEGVITLRGEIKSADLDKLMPSLHALKPKKIENELVIK